MRPSRIRHALLIVNPASRRGARERDRARVMSAFSSAGVDVEVRVTEEPGHAARIAGEGAVRHDAVFTFGGDGTAIEAIGALAGSGTPVGVLPGGTANVLARSLGIPIDPSHAVMALVTGDRARLDLGRVAGGDRFVLGVGVGIDATMIAETPPRLKRRFGIFAYVGVGIRTVLRNRSFRVAILVDGRSVERVASSVLIANFGTLLHRLITLGEGIRQDDGLLNACIFSPSTPRDSLRIAWRLMRKDFRPDPCLYYLSGKNFVVTTDPVRQAQADGELIGFTPLEVSVEALAGTLLVPSGKNGSPIIGE